MSVLNCKGRGNFMELKDVVLSVLSDIQDEEEQQQVTAQVEAAAKEVREKPKSEPAPKPAAKAKPQKVEMKPRPAVAPAKPKPAAGSKSDEEQFLRNLKERILVMFEGFNSPKNQNTDAKVDLTINFLEYLLSVTDERLDAINASKK